MKENGCEATVEAEAAIRKAKAEQDTRLALDQPENSAGGECNAKTGGETAVSIITTGLGCFAWFGVSAMCVKPGYTSVSQQKAGDGRLCNPS